MLLLGRLSEACLLFGVGQKCLCKDWQDFDAEPTLDHYIKPRKLEISYKEDVRISLV